MVEAATQPASIEALAEAVRASGPFSIVGCGSKTAFRLPGAGERAELNLDRLTGIVDLRKGDQVAVVRAGTSLSELDRALAAEGLWLPWAGAGSPNGSLGGEVSLNLPHLLEGRFGTWRDWVLGVRFVQADGTIVRCGSQVVKNVTGYDLHKLLIGARGTLGVLAEITVRLRSIADRIEPKGPAELPATGVWIQRTLPADYSAAVEAASDRVLALDARTATLWAACPKGESLARFPHDWVLRSGAGAENFDVERFRGVAFQRRAKALFDPESKCNPGEFGIF